MKDRWITQPRALLIRISSRSTALLFLSNREPGSFCDRQRCQVTFQKQRSLVLHSTANSLSSKQVFHNQLAATARVVGARCCRVSAVGSVIAATFACVVCYILLLLLLCLKRARAAGRPIGLLGAIHSTAVVSNGEKNTKPIEPRKLAR